MDDTDQLRAIEQAAQSSLEAATAEISYLENELNDLRANVRENSSNRRKDLENLLSEEVEDRIVKNERKKLQAEQRQAAAQRELLEARRNLRQRIAETAREKVGKMQAEAAKKREFEKQFENIPELKP